MASLASPVRIQAARPADAEAFVALQGSIYEEDRWFVGDGPPPVERVQRRLRALDPEMELVLLAGDWPPDEPPRLHAWLELNRFAMLKMRHVAMLTLAVARERRRQGLGRRLLACAYDWAADVGVAKVQLNVRATNAAAIALYEAEGFELEGREKRQVKTGSGFEDNLLMAKFLRDRV